MMLAVLFIVSLLAILPVAPSLPIGDAQIPITSNTGFPYGSQPVRGVNLGGWLLIEPWITPSLFELTGNPYIVDEWTFGQYQNPNVARSKLNYHWATWITESDFAAIAGAGLNHVRIPIGYWAYDVAPGEPYIQGQHDYLVKAIDWAEKYNLRVIIDLHGAPGSQNGFDNSGQRMPAPLWHTNQGNIDRTNRIIKAIASEFRYRSNVVSVIAPLNSPAGFYGQAVLNPLRQYWYDSYGNIRYPFGTDQKSDTLVMINDAFQPLNYWNNFMPYPKWENVAMDTHIYQMFTDQEVSRDEQGHIQSACANAGRLADFNRQQLWTIVGEWTPVMTDCAKYLNGRGVGSRYDGSYSPGHPVYGSCAQLTGPGWSFSQHYKEFLRKSWEAQVITFEKASGWIQWTWKTESADEWSYSAGLKYGWIPQDPTNHIYPNIC